MTGDISPHTFQASKYYVTTGKANAWRACMASHRPASHKAIFIADYIAKQQQSCILHASIFTIILFQAYDDAQSPMYRR